MREFVGFCAVCGRGIYCLDGFLDGVTGPEGRLFCFDCDRIRVKRVYELAHPDDGKRILVDRLWPRGMKKSALKVDAWVKNAAPSSELRKWFGHKADRFPEFREKYEREMTELPELKGAVSDLLKLAQKGRITLLYAAKDPRCNHAIVLKQWLIWQLREIRRKPH